MNAMSEPLIAAHEQIKSNFFSSSVADCAQKLGPKSEKGNERNRKFPNFNKNSIQQGTVTNNYNK